MANFTAAIGTLVDGDPVSAAQLLQIDENLVKAPNFADGCEFTPAADIVIIGPHGISAPIGAGSAFTAQPGVSDTTPQPIICTVREMLDTVSNYSADVGKVTATGGGAYSTASGIFRVPAGTTLAGLIAYGKGPASSVWPTEFTLNCWRVESTTGANNVVGDASTIAASGISQGDYETGFGLELTGISGSSYRTTTAATQYFYWSLSSHQATAGEELYSVVAYVVPTKLFVP